MIFFGHGYKQLSVAEMAFKFTQGHRMSRDSIEDIVSLSTLYFPPFPS